MTVTTYILILLWFCNVLPKNKKDCALLSGFMNSIEEDTQITVGFMILCINGIETTRKRLCFSCYLHEVDSTKTEQSSGRGQTQFRRSSHRALTEIIQRFDKRSNRAPTQINQSTDKTLTDIRERSNRVPT